MSRSGRLTLIHQNDTHAHLEPHWELRWRAGLPEVWRAGGYARIRAIADQIRKETGGGSIHPDRGMRESVPGFSLSPAPRALHDREERFTLRSRSSHDRPHFIV